MILLALLLFAAGMRAHADTSGTVLERTGVGEMLSQAEVLGAKEIRVVVDKAMRGELAFDADALRRVLARLTRALKRGLTNALAALAAPVLAWLAYRLLAGDERGGAMALLCRMSCAATLMRRFVSAHGIAASSLSASVRMVNAAAPVLASALTLTGYGARAAILTPSTALCAGLIDDALRTVGLPLCAAAALIAAAGNLSERFRLNRMFDLVRGGVDWGMRAIMAGFAGMMALQGLMTAGQDAASGRVVRRAMQSILPLVGGELSDSADALLASAVAARNAAGAAGMLAMIGVCAIPFARLVAAALSLRLAAAVLEPVADAGVTRVIGQYAALTQTLAALCACAAMLGMLTLGACLAFAGV